MHTSHHSLCQQPSQATSENAPCNLCGSVWVTTYYFRYAYSTSTFSFFHVQCDEVDEEVETFRIHFEH